MHRQADCHAAFLVGLDGPFDRLLRGLGLLDQRIKLVGGQHAVCLELRLFLKGDNAVIGQLAEGAERRAIERNRPGQRALDKHTVFQRHGFKRLLGGLEGRIRRAVLRGGGLRGETKTRKRQRCEHP